MFDTIEVFRVGSDGVAGAEVGEVPLDVARGTAASWGGETDIGRHAEEIS